MPAFTGHAPTRSAKPWTIASLARAGTRIFAWRCQSARQDQPEQDKDGPELERPRGSFAWPG